MLVICTLRHCSAAELPYAQPMAAYLRSIHNLGDGDIKTVQSRIVQFLQFVVGEDAKLQSDSIAVHELILKHDIQVSKVLNYLHAIVLTFTCRLSLGTLSHWSVVNTRPRRFTTTSSISTGGASTLHATKAAPSLHVSSVRDLSLCLIS